MLLLLDNIKHSIGMLIAINATWQFQFSCVHIAAATTAVAACCYPMNSFEWQSSELQQQLCCDSKTILEISLSKSLTMGFFLLILFSAHATLTMLSNWCDKSWYWEGRGRFNDNFIEFFGDFFSFLLIFRAF